MLDIILAAVALASPCEARILSYEGWREAPDQQWSFSAATPDGGGIDLFGAEHLRDPAADQFARIASSFEATKPTIAFYEGPDRGLASDAKTAITDQG